VKPGQNTNHPKKGSSCKVDPIKDTRDIKAIKKMLFDNPRNFCLFVLGINTNLRASDLVKITVGQVRNVRVNGDFEIIQTKTKKKRRLTLNKASYVAVQNLIRAMDNPPDSRYLFSSQRRGNKSLSVSSVVRLVKTWCAAIHLKGNYGSHTLRKTFGYQQRVQFGVGLPELMVSFNHATQRETLNYLCIQPEELKDIYKHNI